MMKRYYATPLYNKSSFTVDALRMDNLPTKDTILDPFPIAVVHF